MTIVKRNGNFPFIFDDFFNRYNRGLADYSNTDTTIPAVNIKESPENFVVEVAAPGMNKKDLNVQVDGNVLTIRSEKTTEKEDAKNNNAKYTTREFSYQSFVRSFNLPKDTVDTDKIEAKYEDGVLHLTIPKKEKEKAKEARLIEVS